jgi:cell division protein FtsB
MVEKIKTIAKHPAWQQLRDVRLLGFVVFGVLVLLASWSGVNVISTNYDLQKQIAQLDQQNQVSQLQNTNLQLQNEYLNTDTYLELTARKQFGKAAPGETLLLVPKSVALAHAAELPEAKTATTPGSTASSDQPQRSNYQAWLDFILHRGS